MTDQMTNFIRFDDRNIEGSVGHGRISTLDFGFEITVTPHNATVDRAPSHSVYATSPDGFQISVGAIWSGTNRRGGRKWTLSIPSKAFIANLGRYPGQTDAALQAVIPFAIKQGSYS